MDKLFEYSDILNSPVEAFYFDSRLWELPVESHWHYFVEVIYMLEGEVNVNCNRNTYTLCPGEMIFMPPQAIHSIYNKTGETVLFAVLKFDVNRLTLSGNYLPKIGSALRNIAPGTQFPLTLTKEDFGEYSLRPFFEGCIREIDKKQYGYDACVDAMLTQFLVQLLRIWRLRGYTLEQEPAGGEADYTIHEILMYIDQHSQEHIVVAELAKMCNMSYSYFAKTFHRLYGQSCKEYIEFVRLCKVEKLLLFTSYDLNYISSETGFADCSHLIRVFKRKYHVTPKQYRLSHGAAD